MLRTESQLLPLIFFNFDIIRISNTYILTIKVLSSQYSCYTNFLQYTIIRYVEWSQPFYSKSSTMVYLNLFAIRNPTRYCYNVKLLLQFAMTVDSKSPTRYFMQLLLFPFSSAQSYFRTRPVTRNNPCWNNYFTLLNVRFQNVLFLSEVMRLFSKRKDRRCSSRIMCLMFNY